MNAKLFRTPSRRNRTKVIDSRRDHWLPILYLASLSNEPGRKNFYLSGMNGLTPRFSPGYFASKHSLKSFLFVVYSGILCMFSLTVHGQKALGERIAGKREADTALVTYYLRAGEKARLNNPDSSGYYYQKARAIALQIQYTKGLSNFIADDIKLLNRKGQFEEALALARQHVTFARQLKDNTILMNAYNEIANEEEYLGDFQSSTDYYIRALKLATQLKSSRMERLISNNLSSVFISLKDYKTAYRYSEQAFQLAQMAQDSVTIGDCFINMGVSEIHQQKYALALAHFNEAEKIGYQRPDMTLVADALSDKGLVYYTMHRLNSSENEYQQQKAIAERYHLPYEDLYALFELAVVKKDKGNFSSAAQYAEKAIAIGEKLNTDDELMEMYDTMAVIQQELGNFPAALLYKNKFEALNETVRNAAVQTNIHHLTMQYRTAQKDKEIAEQNLRIERSTASIERKNTWIGISLAGIFALMVILALSFRSYRQRQKINQQLLLNLQKEHEVNTLKAKMQAREEERNRIGREMHDDVGSALTTILYLSDELQNQDTAGRTHTVQGIAETATAVMDKMNEIIWSMNKEYDTLDDLIAYTRQHAAQFLQNHHLGYHFNMPDTPPSLHLSGEERRNIYLVVKEALHNIVKHASATEVSITFQLNYRLDVTIKDNGKGIDNATLSRFGNGLKNMRRRMETIGGNFDISTGRGTTVRLQCPLNGKNVV